MFLVDAYFRFRLKGVHLENSSFQEITEVWLLPHRISAWSIKNKMYMVDDDHV